MKIPRVEEMNGIELLNQYLALPEGERKRRFADTYHTARLAGVSQRTVQFWIEIGRIRALRIGHKYQVDLESLREYLCASMAE